MKKNFFIVAFFLSSLILTGCGKESPQKKYNNRPEQHANWVLDNVSKGNFNSILKNVYIPKDVSDKQAFLNAVKEKLNASKASIDAAGGVDKVNVQTIDVKLAVKLKKSNDPIYTTVTMMKTGPESYSTVISPNRVSDKK